MKNSKKSYNHNGWTLIIKNSQEQKKKAPKNDDNDDGDDDNEAAMQMCNSGITIDNHNCMIWAND